MTQAIDIDTPSGPARAHLHHADRPAPRWCWATAPGAGWRHRT